MHTAAWCCGYPIDSSGLETGEDCCLPLTPGSVLPVLVGDPDSPDVPVPQASPPLSGPGSDHPVSLHDMLTVQTWVPQASLPFHH